VGDADPAAPRIRRLVFSCTKRHGSQVLSFHSLGIGILASRSKGVSAAEPLGFADLAHGRFAAVRALRDDFQQFNLAARLDVLTNVLMGRSPTSILALADAIWPEQDSAGDVALERRHGFARRPRADQLSGVRSSARDRARAGAEPDIILAERSDCFTRPRATAIVMDRVSAHQQSFRITVIVQSAFASIWRGGGTVAIVLIGMSPDGCVRRAP